MRYYYEDPLEAAYMAKHYGMKLDPEIEVYIYRDEENFKYYIHPDSLPLLEPMDGDLVTDAVISQIAMLKEMRKADLPVGKIIQRAGKAFHWPKKENV